MVPGGTVLIWGRRAEALYSARSRTVGAVIKAFGAVVCVPDDNDYYTGTGTGTVLGYEL